jgi:RNA polymerase sigma-70 factor, ECF subfamily
VLGHSLEEISEVLESTVPAVKANLHRGRQRLVELAAEPDDRPPPVLAETDRQRLAAYVARFNARDFDALRAQLADEVKVEVVNRTRLNGRGEVGRYFGNYSQSTDWHLVPGLVDRRPAVIVQSPDQPSGPPIYFMLLDWADGRLLGIRDFRYARYAVEDAELIAFS